MATWPIQQTGSHGEDVRTVQYLLAVHGHAVTVDGQFGPATKAAVQAFQSGAGLPSDGIVGNQTWPKLIVTVAAGASGARVRAVQGQLRAQGWRLAIDGVFGSVTTRSIRDYQTAHGLTADATVGAVTWHSLIAGFVHLGSAALSSSHLYDAWGVRDRATALRNATLAAVDTVMRGERGTLTDAGCNPDPVLGSGNFICAYTFEGGAVDFNVKGNSTDGFYVDSVTFIAD
jgi:hypothetical protein